MYVIKEVTMPEGLEIDALMMPNGSMPDIEELYREYRPLLISIAYRMLGSMSDAEDAVQDVFVAFAKLDGIDIKHPKAYLVKMVTNRLLNMLKAAPRKREYYPGQWLPEPVIEFGSEEQPHEYVLRREQLGYALLVLLQTCTPSERAVFVLRESLGCEYADIAAMLNKSEAACRKIYSRAASKIGQRAHTDSDAALDEKIVRFTSLFAHAIETGQFESFIRLLTKDAVMISDGGGIVRAALNPIYGRDRIAAFFSGIAKKGSLIGEIRPAWISGQRGLLLLRKNKPPFAFALHPDDTFTAVRAVYLVSNPEKLTRMKP